MDDVIYRKDARKLLESCTWGKSQREAIDELLKIPAVPVREDICEALKKQQPVPPDYVSDGYDPEGQDVWEPYCPSCGHNLEDSGEPRYCMNCGQALQWEDKI